MAKFCTKCGEELIQGEKHICSAKKEETKLREAKEVKEIKSDIDFKEGFTNCLEFLKTVFVKPIETVENFVTEKKYLSGIILIVLTAIASGLYKIATLKAAYGSPSSKGFNSNELVNLITKNFISEPDYLKEFMTEFATNLAQYALIAVIGYFIIKSLFKGKSTIKEVVSATGASLGIILLAYLVNAILVFIDAEVVGYIRNYIMSFSEIFSVLILYKGIKHTSGVDKNKLFIIVASMSVCATIVMDIINKLFD